MNEIKIVKRSERMKTLRERGVDVSAFITDWCIECKFSDHLIKIDEQKVCRTLCNGHQAFGKDKLILPDNEQPHLVDYVLSINGERVVAKWGAPLKFEQEVGVKHE